MMQSERGGKVGIYSFGTYLTLKLGLVPEETTEYFKIDEKGSKILTKPGRFYRYDTFLGH